MDVGRELDALVAEKVMGYKFIPLPSHNQHGLCDWCGRVGCEHRNDARVSERGQCDGFCNYSDDIAAAWQVVEHLKDLGWAIELADMRLNPNVDAEDRGWWYEIDRWDNPDAVMDGKQFASHHADLDGGADTVPLAICHAALKAVGVTL